MKSSHFKGLWGTFLEVQAPSSLECSRILMVGVGEKGEGTEKQFQNLGGMIFDHLSKTPDESMEIHFQDITGVGLTAGDVATQMGFGALLRSWRFDKYRTKEKDEFIPSLATGLMVTENPLEAGGKV